MNGKELQFMLQEGEGLKIEFKESFDSKGIARKMVAFANSAGGRIFLGVDDAGNATGIRITNRLKSQVQDVARSCDPPVETDCESAGGVLLIKVPEGTDKPYRCSSGFYVREGPNSQKLSRDEIIQLITGLGKVRFGEQVNNAFRFPHDFDDKKFSEFLRKSSISKTMAAREILVNLSLGTFVKRKFTLNNAGVLLFAKEPERFFRQNFVTCVVYKGKERVHIIDRKDFKNDLLSNYEDAFAFLEQHLRLEYRIKGHGPREEIPEIPYGALREGVINALIHRDYFEDRFGVFVEIFDDRVEITNKGKLLFDKRHLGRISMPRNPVLFDIFHRLGLIEKVGSGINRIKALVKKRKLNVIFEVDEFFKVVFSRPKETAKTSEKTSEKILALMRENPSINAKDIADGIGRTPRAVEMQIARLKQKGILKRIGPAKGGRWEVVEPSSTSDEQDNKKR